MERAQDDRMLRELGLEKLVERARKQRVRGLVEDRLRDDNVRLEQVHGHVTLAAVVDEAIVAEEVQCSIMNSR